MAQPAHVVAQLGQLAELLPQRGQLGDVVPERGDPGHLVAQRRQAGDVGAQLGDAGDLVAQLGQPGEVAAQRVELGPHRLLGLAAQLALQLQLVLAPGGDLPVQLVLVGPAQLRLAGARGDLVGGPAAGGEGGEDERPGHAHDGEAQELRVVGEEDRERRRDRQREAAGLEQGPAVGDAGARSDVVLAQWHDPSVAAEGAVFRTGIARRDRAVADGGCESGAVTLTLLGWRRRVAALYAAARSRPGPGGRLADLAGRPRRAVRRPPRLTAGRGRAGRVPAGSRSPPTTPRCGSTPSLEPADPARLEVPTAADGTVPLDRIGAVELGDLGRLDVWWLGRLRRRGVPAAARRHRRARPPTAAAATCSTPSRAPTSGGDGARLVVDLNFAYHPSCTYDPRWSCPLAPEGNRVDDAGHRRGAVAPRRLVLSERSSGGELLLLAKIGSVDSARASETSPCRTAWLVGVPRS